MRLKIDLLFVGKDNIENSDIFGELSTRFVSLSSKDPLLNIVEALNAAEPDLIVYSLIGYNTENLNDAEEYDSDYTAIIDFLYRTCNDVSILVICTGKQYIRLTNHYGSRRKFFVLVHPTAAENIVFACRQIVSCGGNVQLKKLIEPKLQKTSVLVVDDNAMALRTTKRLLEDAYQVSVASSGTQLFMAIAAKRPDVILMDYEMPVINGEIAMKMLKEDSDTKNIPVIFVTSAADEETVKKLLSLKPAGYLLKPVERHKVVDLIEKAVKQ